jgi:cytochrome c peroxidase
MSDNPNSEKLNHHLALKIILQLGLFTILALFAWQYLNGRTSPPAVNTFKELSDAELAQLVDSLRLDAPSSVPDPKEENLAKLGHDFFFDPGFSANGQISCASCHNPDRSFTDGKQRSLGQSTTKMNAPTLVNVAKGHWFFWNGRADSLEAQAVGPLEHPGEHGFSRSKVLRRLIEHYKKPYEKIFGTLPKISHEAHSDNTPPNLPLVSDEIAAYALTTLGSKDFQKHVLASAMDQSLQPIEIIKNYAAFDADTRPSQIKALTAEATNSKDVHVINKVFMNFTRALAAFERTIKAGNSPFDQFSESLVTTKSSASALNNEFGPSELRGLRIFAGKGQCIVCHSGPTLSDEQFHNIGLPARDNKSIDLGRAQGMLLVRSDPFNCLGDYLAEKKQTESCLELGYLESENIGSVGAFKTPTLRQLRHTAPYGHDGRFKSLSEVLRHYNDLAESPAVGRTESTLRPLGLNDGELEDLERFLLSLHGTTTFLQR